MDTVIDTAVALVTTAILTGTWAIARKRYKLLNQRDALLAEVQQTLLAVRDDNRCQYTALWFYFILHYNSSGTLSLTTPAATGIAAGASLVGTAETGYLYSGFGYRVS